MLVTLLTDFGLQDTYVGVLKGVIAQINPQVAIVDLTHQIPPQDIGSARFHLMTAYPYFPPGTVHVAVVDPGVGSRRRGVAIAIAGGFLVGPDNGLWSGVLSQTEALAAVELTNPQYWRTAHPSPTFHGRDIFAPVAAHLAAGIALEELGFAIDPATLVQLPLPQVSQQEGAVPGELILTGAIQASDRFGNLITNISAHQVEGYSWAVQLSDRALVVHQTYSDCPPGEPLALIGSHGWVEIAVNGGNARSHLQSGWGQQVQVILKTQSVDDSTRGGKG